MTTPASSNEVVLRAIPSVDQILRSESVAPLRQAVGLQLLTKFAREVAKEMRGEIQSEAITRTTKEALLSEAVRRVHTRCRNEGLTALRRVINATGVIIHTNLGRAPLSEAARSSIAQVAGYCTLEYDASAGSRGKRGAHAEELLVQLTGAEAALIVNNCAAAALLILTVLAGDGETIVSRGELVEIGGDFRVPDVMSNSGTQMVEIGSTNRTRLEDYRRAMNKDTRLIMRVHPSNYRIIGFTDTPQLSQLAILAHESDLLLYEDAGSGVLSDLSSYGITDEPIISESILAGADVVSFSGDKLLGATQAGLIVGKREIVERLRRHSLYRALRSDKLSLVAIEATLDAHRRGAIDEIPALRMLSLTKDEIHERAKSFVEKLAGKPVSSELTATIVDGQSAVGGGSGPNVHPQTALIALQHERLSAGDLENKLRLFSPAVIARIAGDQVLLDLRTVAENEESELLAAVTSLAA